MSAPSKANISKLDNPARAAANLRRGTEPWYIPILVYTKNTTLLNLMVLLQKV